MLPVTERKLFWEAHNSVCVGRSYVIHGPYQSGKTSFLWALHSELQKKNPETVKYFDISDVVPRIRATQDKIKIVEELSEFLSVRIFGEALSWNLLTAKLQDLPGTPRYYLLVDEFQSIFDSENLLEVAKNFFRNLASKPGVSYVGVGTFRLKELFDADETTMESPFNKAIFASMPPFSLEEMNRLFELYQEHCDTAGISPRIRDNIVRESGGHPASFMILLKLTLQFRPIETNWSRLLKENVDHLLNGTQKKLRTHLQSMDTEQKVRVRDLTKKQLNDWEFTSDDFNRVLLNIGVIYTSDERTARFTSGIILRICIDTLWPRPRNRLSREEIGDAINILGLGLQCISPPTVVHPQVCNKNGPQENAFQVALYAALNGLLPTTMMCLFEAKAKNKDHIDLMLTENSQTRFGYELKVNAITKSDFKSHLEQASKYAKHYKVPIYLVNFYLKGHLHPVQLTGIPHNVFVVNVQHSHDCKEFVITAPNGDKTTVMPNDQS